MKQNELRIGNLIGIVLPEAETQATADHIKWISEGDNIYKPIPLTEEWLVKFGFRKSANLYLSIGYFEFIWQGELFLDIEGQWLTLGCKYVHSLQNLYFALTGKELEIN